MLSAVGRLLRIFIFVLFGLSFALFGLRTLGSGQRYAESDHPFAKIPFIWAGTPEGFPIWRLRLNQERVWQIVIDGEMKPLPDGKGQAGIWLEVIDPTSMDTLPKLSEYINAQGLGQKVIFSSQYQAVLREMRKVEPLWLYTSSVAEEAKVRFLTALYLETVVTIDSDILVLDKIKSPRLIDEVHKRHKKIFLSVRSQKELDLALARQLKDTQKIDGAVIAP